MAVRLSETVRNAMLDDVAAAVDGGAGSGLLRIYTGPQPADAAAAATGTLLVEIALSDPAFVPSTAAVLEFDVTIPPEAPAVGNGQAGWARLLDSAEAPVLDASVGVVGADILVNTSVVATGQTIKVLGGSLSLPAA
ncbi:hypothetical protein [Nocardioides jensenii]|uniref:hypothetical protein n=1 Tax=Nocardioides jensenii TaxID=1843 RepID=UPI0008319A01|nr:hypothetical protein [Nocardioides jensenii]